MIIYNVSSYSEQIELPSSVFIHIPMLISVHVGTYILRQPSRAVWETLSVCAQSALLVTLP